MFFWDLAKCVCQMTFRMIALVLSSIMKKSRGTQKHAEHVKNTNVHKHTMTTKGHTCNKNPGEEFFRQHALKLRRECSVGLHVVYNLSLSSLIIE